MACKQHGRQEETFKQKTTHVNIKYIVLQKKESSIVRTYEYRTYEYSGVWNNCYDSYERMIVEIF